LRVAQQKSWQIKLLKT